MYRSGNKLREGRKKAVFQIDIMSREVINVFNSVSDAARSLGNKNYAKGIGLVAGGKRSDFCGYKWMYEEDYQKMIAEQKAGEKK